MATVPSKYTKLEQMLQKALENGFFAGGAAAVCSANTLVWSWRGGLRQKKPVPLPLHKNTAFDLASLTKIVCTTLCACRLMENGLLDFDKPLGAYIKNAGNFAHSTIGQILTHSAGFIAEERLCKKIVTPQEALDYLVNSPRLYEAGTKTVYSCFGFIVLGAVISAITKKSLSSVCAEEVTKPLGMKNTFFIPIESTQNKTAAKSKLTQLTKNVFYTDDFAATEYDEQTGNMLCGIVHDENARFLGGIAGNAGLFSTLGDMVKLAQMFLNEGIVTNGKCYLQPKTLALLRTNATSGMEEARGIGFKLAQYGAEQFAGTKLSRSSFGHTGFTGTSLLLDPDRKIGVILLTNRIHPSRSDKRLLEFRGHFHDAVAENTDTEYT